MAIVGTMGGLFLVNGQPVEMADSVAAQFGFPRAPDTSALGTRSILGGGASSGITDPCVLAAQARKAGKSAAIIAALDTKCRAQRLTTTRASAGAPSTATAAAEPPTGYPEPKDEGVSPALIAAGVIAAGAIGFIAYKKFAR